MRISDWSSDVCSSDLLTTPVATAPFPQAVVLSSSVPVLAPPVSWVPSSLCSTTQVMPATAGRLAPAPQRSEEHSSELQSLMRISYAVFCLKKKKIKKNYNAIITELTTIERDTNN